MLILGHSIWNPYFPLLFNFNLIPPPPSALKKFTFPLGMGACISHKATLSLILHVKLKSVGFWMQLLTASTTFEISFLPRLNYIFLNGVTHSMELVLYLDCLWMKQIDHFLFKIFKQMYCKQYMYVRQLFQSCSCISGGYSQKCKIAIPLFVIENLNMEDINIIIDIQLQH